MQFHPEFSSRDMGAVILHNREMIAEFGGDVEAALASCRGEDVIPPALSELVSALLGGEIDPFFHGEGVAE